MRVARAHMHGDPVRGNLDDDAWAHPAAACQGHRDAFETAPAGVITHKDSLQPQPPGVLRDLRGVYASHDVAFMPLCPRPSPQHGVFSMGLNMCTAMIAHHTSHVLAF